MEFRTYSAPFFTRKAMMEEVQAFLEMPVWKQHKTSSSVPYVLFFMLWSTVGKNFWMNDTKRISKRIKKAWGWSKTMHMQQTGGSPEKHTLQKTSSKKNAPLNIYLKKKRFNRLTNLVV